MMCAVCDEKIRRTLKHTDTQVKIRYNVMKSSRDRALEEQNKETGKKSMATRTRQEEEEDIKRNELSLFVSRGKAVCRNIGLHVASELGSVTCFSCRRTA